MNFIRRIFSPPAENGKHSQEQAKPSETEISTAPEPSENVLTATGESQPADAARGDEAKQPVDTTASGVSSPSLEPPGGSDEAESLETKAADEADHTQTDGEDSETNKNYDELQTSPVKDQKATAPLPTTGNLGFGTYVDGVTRPLPADVSLDVTPLNHVMFGQATDIGRIRTNNQDAVYSFFATGRSADSIPDFGLFVVADGMGGHQDGEKASAITVRTVASQVLNTLYFPLLSKQTLNTDVPITETLAAAIQKANTEIMAHVPDGGTTLSTVVIIADRAYIAHVGDSRIYLLHKGQIEKLTRDHSLVQRLIELDQITLEEAAEHPQKNVLYRALGQNENVEVDTLTRRLPSGGLLLLCSDGLWNQVSEEQITDAVKNMDNLQEACHKLVTLANNQGGVDNVTVVLLQLPG